MLSRSPRDVFSGSTIAAFFSTGTDSPVKDASSALSDWLSSRRKSAGTISPASSSTRSPGTSSAAAINFCSPSRRTRAWGEVIFFKASIAFSARPSWTTPRMALIRTMAMMTPVSIYSPRKAETRLAAIRIRTMTSLNCASSFCSIVCFFFSFRALGPYFSSKAAACCESSPCSALLSSRAIRSASCSW